jgi:hypothetical protein
MTGNGDEELKTCFVVMPVTTPAIYLDRSDDPDHFTHVLHELFVPALEGLGYKVLLPSVAGSELIHAEIIKNLERAHLVLCDLSSLNPNVFFELGIRTALDRPIVLVRDKLTLQIPFDLNAINVLTYDGSLKSWIVKDEISRLAAHIEASAQSAPDTGNAMWRYFGLTKRASPAETASNPLEAKMDLILTEITKPRLRERLEGAREDAPDPLLQAQSEILNRIQAIARDTGRHVTAAFSPDGRSLYVVSDDDDPSLPKSLLDFLDEVDHTTVVKVRILPD